MIRKNTLAFALAGAFAIGSAGVLYAQSGQKGTGMMSMTQDCPRMMGIAATGENFDDAAVRGAFGRMGDLHEEVGVRLLRARHQATRVRTAEQREALAGLRSEAMETCRMMHGDMRHQEGGA